MKVISLGAGVQSTTMLLMSLHGDLERPDLAIFADTGWEPPAVYKHLGWLNGLAQEQDFPIITVSAGNLRDNVLKGRTDFAPMPLFASRDGKVTMLRRQCSREYKLHPIQQYLKPYARRKPVEVWIGISLDEILRMKPSRVKYIANRWPLIEQRMRRQDCIAWLKKHGYPVPPKSACVGCPFHDTEGWRTIRRNKDTWQDAVEFDQAIRSLPRIEGKCYLHRSCIPLDQVDLSTDFDRGQYSLFNEECEGLCGV